MVPADMPAIHYWNTLRSLSVTAAVSVGLAVAILSAQPAQAAKNSCASAREFQSLNARVLQTELMVAALSCNERKNYNSFVKRHQKTLIREGRVMAKYFARIYGKGSKRKVDTFVTRLANQVSKRSHDQEKTRYCEQAKILFLDVLTTEPKQFAGYYQGSRFQSHGVRSCNDQSVAQARKKK